MQPFRFGVVFTESVATGREWADLARRVEGQGFSTLLVADHYVNALSCTPLITAAAAATSTLRVGSYVLNNDFRHPAMLAKEIATIDVLSGGRVELALGAGWLKQEYDQIGLPFEPGSVRADRLAEAVAVLKQLFAGGKVHHRGRHYQLDGLEGLPLPIQKPLPLLIGGGGPRMLALAAREAQIVGFVPQALPDGGLDPDGFGEAAFAEKVRRFDAAVSESGRDDGGPERSILAFAVVRSADQVDPDWVRPELVERSPFTLIGDPSKVVETLHERRERWGLSYTVCFADHIDSLAPVVAQLAS